MSGSTFGTDNSVGSTRALLEAQLPAVREQRRKLEDQLAAVLAQENAMVAVLEGLEALASVPVGGPDSAAGVDARSPGEPPAAVQDNADVPKDRPEAGGEATVGTDGSARPAKARPAAKRTQKTVTRKADSAAKKTAKKAAGKPATGRTAVAGVRKQSQEAPPMAAPGKKTTARRAPTATGPKQTTRSKVAPKAAPDTGPQLATERDSAPTRPVAGRRRLTDAQRVLDVLNQSDGPLRAGEVSSRLGLDGQNGTVDAVRTALERLTKSGRVQRTGRGLYTAAAN
ncbi:type IV toxin-antitoxin system AbiEi family antitoxin domain-containing protein [Kitasatospora sp. NPDC059571]|uniref:type IV toxin-antitoxin system AbiEi family antitoxin domain-containing protein n=1 Tax=Kitasatospora sp. NPDC059571 TaxID=3346871 RepID=UPI0036A3AC53